MKKYILSIIILASLLYTGQAQAAEFNPNFILSNEEMLDNSTMDKSAIQSFLLSKNSYLAKYSCPNFLGVNKTAAEIIFDAANNSYDCTGIILDDPSSESERRQKCVKAKINPRFILVLLQKEQGLVENSNPRQSQLDWAAGYGCPDGASCSTRFKGFGKQVNSAVLQFYDYMINPQLYTYKAGGTYTFTNPYGTISKATMIVTPMNQATAALYNYTPHVYNGNYNFYKLWQRYFIRDYPDGSLLQAKGQPGVWLIQNGKKRPFTSKGALTSRFDLSRILMVNASELDKYPKGDPIKFPQYSVVRSPAGALYLLVDNFKRGFTSKEAFRRIGINPEEIMNASFEDLELYAKGADITATTSYPTGALLQDQKSGGIYWVENDSKYPVPDRIFLRTKFRYKAITAADPKKLSLYNTMPPVKFDDGVLLKSDISSAVYVLVNGERRPFIKGEDFEYYGYKWTNVISIPDRLLISYPLGDPIFSSDAQPSAANPATTTPDILSSASTSLSVSSNTSTSTQ